MTLRLRDIALDLDQEETQLPRHVERQLQLPVGAVQRLEIVRRAIDARRKRAVQRIYTVRFTVADEEALLRRHGTAGRLERESAPVPPPLLLLTGRPRVLVVGMGPAGLLAAHSLVQAGAQVTLIDRGDPVEERVHRVNGFWNGEPLDPESNVQFGEGGAGTFSDGKLTTRVRNPWAQQVLRLLVDCGAPESILYDAKPHVGTDRLRLVLIRLRQKLQAAGVVFSYRARLDALLVQRGRVVGGRLADGRELPCDALLLAPGHSARDTYDVLHRQGVALEAKPLAIGLRVEHPAARINQIQYGVATYPRLPAAEYALTYNDAASGRGIYSFCMCPGGEVVLSSSEPEGIVVNGMSRLARSGELSNSALVVAVRPDDFGSPHPLAGVAFQRHWEQQAFAAVGRVYRAPAQNLLAFLGRGGGAVRSSCRPAVVETDLAQTLPPFVVRLLREALPQFDKKMRGFVSSEATLVGVETRTSAPVRILRGEDGQSVSHPGLFPAGEGAGYAGGIMSAALDGIRAAESICRISSLGSVK